MSCVARTGPRPALLLQDILLVAIRVKLDLCHAFASAACCTAVWAARFVFISISDLVYEPCSILDLVPDLALPALDKD